MIKTIPDKTNPTVINKAGLIFGWSMINPATTRLSVFVIPVEVKIKLAWVEENIFVSINILGANMK